MLMARKSVCAKLSVLCAMLILLVLSGCSQDGEEAKTSLPKLAESYRSRSENPHEWKARQVLDVNGTTGKDFIIAYKLAGRGDHELIFFNEGNTPTAANVDGITVLTNFDSEQVTVYNNSGWDHPGPWKKREALSNFTDGVYITRGIFYSSFYLPNETDVSLGAEVTAAIEAEAESLKLFEPDEAKNVLAQLVTGFKDLSTGLKIAYIVLGIMAFVLVIGIPLWLLFRFLKGVAEIGKSAVFALLSFILFIALGIIILGKQTSSQFWYNLIDSWGIWSFTVRETFISLTTDLLPNQAVSFLISIVAVGAILFGLLVFFSNVVGKAEERLRRRLYATGVWSGMMGVVNSLFSLLIGVFPMTRPLVSAFASFMLAAAVIAAALLATTLISKNPIKALPLGALTYAAGWLIGVISLFSIYCIIMFGLMMLALKFLPIFFFVGGLASGSETVSTASPTETKTETEVWRMNGMMRENLRTSKDGEFYQVPETGEWKRIHK